MARLRTLQSIRDEARQLADEANTGSGNDFVSDATANRWINQAYAKLVDLLVKANPDWYLDDEPIQTQAGTLEYPLPEDFYEVRGVDLELSADHRIPIGSYNFVDRNRHTATWPPPRWIDQGITTRYRVIRKGMDGSAARIRFEPDPGNHTYRLWYVQAAQELENDGDELDGINGYEEFIVADVAEKMHAKARTDPSVAQKLKAEVEARIELMAARRDQGPPVQVADVRGRY